MNKFRFIEYNVEDKTIDVVIQEYGCHDERHELHRDLYEFWLLIEKKLEWEMNSSDDRGEHKVTLGNLSMDEYWGSNDEEIQKDLYEYIKQNPIAYIKNLDNDQN